MPFSAFSAVDLERFYLRKSDFMLVHFIVATLY